MAAVAAALALGPATAEAFRYPDDAEARLLLDGTQGAPYDGFNMEIDTNGFGAPGGQVIPARMFCVQSNVAYRCGQGSDDLLRVQGTPDLAQLDTTEANALAWLVTHRGGYTDEETQYAIWCITNPGSRGAVGNSDRLCADAQANAVPAAPVLTLGALGATTVDEGTAARLALTTNAASVELAVDDGGALPVLCGTAPDNASATINGSTLVQTLPATTRTFELCLTRDAVPQGIATATLTASLAATGTNLQVWVHPVAPSACQGLIDVVTTGERLTASLAASWRNVQGALALAKSLDGSGPSGASYRFRVQGPGTDFEHRFPDTTGDPWSETFTDLPAGEYTVEELDTAGATSTVVTIVDGSGVQSQSSGTRARDVTVGADATSRVTFVNSFATGTTVTLPPTTVAPTTVAPAGGTAPTSVATTTSTEGPLEGQGNTTPTTSGGSGLAFTGSETRPWLVLAGMALVLGVALLLAARRRGIASR